MAIDLEHVPLPDLVRVQADPGDGWSTPELSGARVRCHADGSGLVVGVAAVGVLSRVHLRWRRARSSAALVLGDAWERSYGELGWQSSARAEQVHPWMVLVHDDQATWGAGVEVRAGAFAAWTVDPLGVSLWLDVRAGADPVVLGDRELVAATVRWVSGDGDPFEVQCALTAALCPDPLPVGPLVGANNWYYAYGRNFDADAVVRDARLVSDLVGDHAVRPFGVVDDGWSVDGTADGRVSSGGPWDRGPPGVSPTWPTSPAGSRRRGCVRASGSARCRPASNRVPEPCGAGSTGGPSTRATRQPSRRLPPTFAGCAGGGSS